MKLKILSVDFYLEGKGIENYSFHDAPSFSDYDAVILDPEKISDLWEKITPERDGSLNIYASQDGGFSRGLKFPMSRRNNELISLLKITKGIVICILRDRGRVLNIHENAGPWTIDRYSWLPNVINFYSVIHGKEIKIVNKHHPFRQILSTFKDSIHFEVILKPDKNVIPIATNKVDELIAVEYRVGEGKLIFLPPINNYNSEKAGGVLIDCIRGSLNWNIPSKKPEWVSGYSLPGDDEKVAKMGKLNDEISRIKDIKKEIEAEYNRSEMLKALLYEQGKYGLEPAVREAFKLLGFKVLNLDEYEEEYDLFAREDNLIVIGEIEGSEAQVDITKYRQLLDYVDREETTNGNKVKGILIGNGFIKKPPDERGEQFTESAIRGCKSRRFCRITTYELYKTIRAVLSGAIQKEVIKEQILNCEDEFKLSTILKSEEVVCGN